MKKAKIFNKIVFALILSILCYFCSYMNVDAAKDPDCKSQKYHTKNVIAGAGDDNYYPTMKTVVNLVNAFSTDELKAEYGKVNFSVSSATDGYENAIKVSDFIECSNDNNNYVKGCSGVYLSISKPIYVRLNRSVNTSKFSIKFVANEKSAEVNSGTKGYCSDDIYRTAIYEGFNNTPQVTTISYKYKPGGETSFGKEIKCDKASYSDAFEKDFCEARSKAKTIGDPSKTSSLTCDHTKTYKQSDLEGENYYKNTKYLYHSSDLAVTDGKGKAYKKEGGKYVLGYLTYKAAGISDSDAITCKKTCQEVIEVKYGPPIVSKAGMCFEYKVKIISRVNCYSEFEHKPIRDYYPLCTPSPTCIHGDVEYNTAGPDDSFDSCVKNCDGGKYTSKCSKSCYKKIYGSNNRNVSNNYESLIATKLKSDCSGKSGRLCDSSCTYCSNGIKKDKYKNDYSSSYVEETKPNRGYYYRSDGAIGWIGDYNPYSEYLGYDGYKYFSFGKYVPGRWYRGTDAWGYYSTNYGVYRNDGFYRGGTASNYCHDECSWDGCGAGSYLNEDDLFDTIKQNEDTLENARKACMINSVCTTSTIDKVTFNIKADGNEIPSSSPDYIKYKSTGWDADSRKNKSTTLMYDTFDDKHLISCYDNKNNDFFKGVKDEINTRVSRATWHFPGTWFDTKTNTISYTPHDNWYEVKDKYCTSTETKDVNVEYWNYYVNKIMKDDSKKSEEDRKYEQKIFAQYDNQCKNVGKGTISDPINITDDSYHPSMNIVASTRGFGFFGWNIDVSCFYALNTCLNGYKIRSVSTADVFPSKEGTPITKDEKIGREPGYNWSNSSIVSKNENYVVNPPRLITEVQQFGQAGKDAIYKDENLEYSFNLSSLDMKSIRDKFESEKSENYNIYNGKVYDPNKKSDLKVIYNGIPRYKSDLIDDLVKSGKGKRPPGDGFICNNIKNLSTGECDDYSSYKPASTK